MTQIRKFDVSVVVEIFDPAFDDERELDDVDNEYGIDPLVAMMAVSEARGCLERWLLGDREYISVHIMEVP